MDNLIAGLTIEQIEALKLFYERHTGQSATEISLGASDGKTMEKQLRYILGIMKNRFFKSSVESQGMTLLLDAANAGVPVSTLKQYATSCMSWTQYREKVLSLIEEVKT